MTDNKNVSCFALIKNELQQFIPPSIKSDNYTSFLK